MSRVLMKLQSLNVPANAKGQAASIRFRLPTTLSSTLACAIQIMTPAPLSLPICLQNPVPRSPRTAMPLMAFQDHLLLTVLSSTRPSLHRRESAFLGRHCTRTRILIARSLSDWSFRVCGMLGIRAYFGSSNALDRI